MIQARRSPPSAKLSMIALVWITLVRCAFPAAEATEARSIVGRARRARNAFIARAYGGRVAPSFGIRKETRSGLLPFMTASSVRPADHARLTRRSRDHAARTCERPRPGFRRRAIGVVSSVFWQRRSSMRRRRRSQERRRRE